MRTARRILVMLPVLSLAGCAVTHAPGPAPDAGGTTLAPAQLLAAVQQDADQIDTAKDATERTQLLVAATTSAQQCLAQAPTSPTCLYAKAQVQGLTARERPLQAVALLKDMLANLTKVEAADPALDHAGAARLSAIVLMRAPPWPLGPGDAEAAVAAAQRAVMRDAAYPPNQITLAQTQARNDGAAPARLTYGQAQKSLMLWNAPAGANEEQTRQQRAQWQSQIDQGLHDLQ